MSDAHESPIKTPTQLITIIALSFIVPIIIIALLVSYMTAAKREGAGSDALTPQAIEARIKPVASVEIRDPNTPRVLKAGAEVYKAQCSACHEVGAANAPKVGDSAAWAVRIKTGYEALLNSALKGKGAMAAQAGGDYSDAEIARAVVHMANASGAKFTEPTAPAPVASSTPATAAAATAAPAVAVASPVAPPVAPSGAAPATPSVAAAAAAPAPASSAAPAATKVDVNEVGKTLYESACIACHAQGVANAPKFGDKASWGDRAKEPIAELVADVIKGKGAMPPKGGRADASAADIKAAVEYMLAALK
jgi:cytochrome c5